VPCRNGENIPDKMDKVVVGTLNVDPLIPLDHLKICCDSHFCMFKGHMGGEGSGLLSQGVRELGCA